MMVDVKGLEPSTSRRVPSGSRTRTGTPLKRVPLPLGYRDEGGLRRETRYPATSQPVALPANVLWLSTPRRTP